MTKDDKDEIRQMLNDVMNSHVNEINGRFNILHHTLLGIKEQVTIANGRTRKLEDAVIDLREKEITHVISCPNNPRIQNLENAEISRKSVFKFVVLLATLSAAIGGLIVGIIK